MGHSKPSIENIEAYRTKVPDTTTLIGDKADYEALPAHWQEQIVFYNQAGSDFLYDYWEHSNLVTGPLYQPFLNSPFPYQSACSILENGQHKKWLYERGIAFGHWVWALSNFSATACCLTWKMVLKLQDALFVGDDVVLFDESLQWCLFYYHEDCFFWSSRTRA
jgi:hypothetical protein